MEYVEDAEAGRDAGQQGSRGALDAQPTLQAREVGAAVAIPSNHFAVEDGAVSAQALRQAFGQVRKSRAEVVSRSADEVYSPSVDAGDASDGQRKRDFPVLEQPGDMHVRLEAAPAEVL